MRKVDKLLFGTAGIPYSTEPRDTVTAVKRLKELNLDAMELEYVRANFPGEESARKVASIANEHSIMLTAHGPYYINLNALESEKLVASRRHILNTAYFGWLSGAESITFHAGFFLKHDPEEVYIQISKELKALVEEIRQKGIDIDIRPELAGKATQFGSLEEIIKVSKEIDGIYPCIDWSHLHARTGAFNTAKEFQKVIDILLSELGEDVLNSLHMHVSGIEYTDKGERKHLNLDESDFNYRDLLKVLKYNNVCGFLICESPSLEDDALIMKKYYESI